MILMVHRHKKIQLTCMTATLVLCITNIFCIQTRVGDIKLTNRTYGEIHESAISFQIINYINPIRSLNTRYTRSLNGLYDFCLDPSGQGFDRGWHNGSLSEQCHDGNFYKMPVPSAFNDIVPNATLRNYIGWFWYQTDFMINPTTSTLDRKLKWFLQFENINYMALIWLKDVNNQSDSKLIGAHVGGHLPITLDISDIIDLSSRDYKASFTITIAVSNKLTEDTIPSGEYVDLSHLIGHNYSQFKPDFDFFHFTGILDDINLIQLSQNFIDRVDFERYVYRDNTNALVQFKVYLDDHVYSNYKMTIHVKCPSRELRTTSSIKSQSSEYEIVEIPVPRYEFDQTFTKYCRIKVHVDSRSIFNADQDDQNSFQDTYEFKYYLPGQFDIISQDKQLQGFGMHHEQLFSGRTMSSAAIMKDLYLLKQTGANIIRTSHYPYSTAYLDACDDLGILVIAECQAVGLKTFSGIKLKLHKQLLLEMMQRDYHHPSILMWSVANEPQCQLNESRPYFKSLLDYARRDLRNFTTLANRPLTAAIAQSHEDDKLGDLLDVLMINRYYGWYDYMGAVEAIKPALVQSLSGWSRRYPDKPILISEFGAESMVGLHKSVGSIFSEEYQRDLIVAYEKVFDKLAKSRNETGINFIGSMIWNFADFSTHESLERFGANRKGVFTQTREPKLVVETIRRIYQARLNKS